MVDEQEVLMRVQNTLKKAPFTLVELAEQSGLSYAALHSWTHTRRTPRPASRAKLAAGLRRKAAELEKLAADLDAAAG
jgi:transcriptional regulator with XRE-family HTH domain